MIIRAKTMLGFVGSLASALCIGLVEAQASPVTTYDTSVIAWDVGSGQLDNHFAVTTDSGFLGGAIELGLRAEERSVGGIAPAPTSSYSYLVQTGCDPTRCGPSPSPRAWWNFHLAINYAGGITNLSGLTLTIVQSSGTNGAGGTFDLLPVYGVINDENVFSANSYLIDQNALFNPWFSPSYSLANTDPFAYWFFLTATKTDGQTTTSVTGEMCVHTAGQTCVPEPGSAPIVITMLAVLSLLGLALIRRQPSA